MPGRATVIGTATLAAACALVSLTSLHLVLFRRTDIVSVSPAPWVAVAGALFLAAVIAASRLGAERRGWLAALRLSRARAALGLLFFVLLFVFSLTFERATGDGRDYFVQTRSVVMDGDLDFNNEIAEFAPPGVPWVMPPGTPMAWIPFFGAAHAWIGILGAVGHEVFPEGYWNPYQQAVGLGTLLLGYVGLVLLFRLLRRQHNEGLAVIVTWCFALGTFVVYYLTVEATYAHGVALFAVMLFITLALEQSCPRTARQLFALGLAGGFMTAVRWENAAFLLLPLVIDGPHLLGWLRRRQFSSLLSYGAAACGALIGFLPQLLIWGVYQQRYIAVPEMWGEQWWFDALPLEVLFSSDRGLMSWHPIFFVAALGIPLAWYRDRKLVATLTAIVAVLVYANGASILWAGGAGFGYRRLTVAVPLFALGLAAALEYLVRRPRVLPAVLLASLAALNLAMVAGVVQGRLPIGEGATFYDLVRQLHVWSGNPAAAPMNLWLWLSRGVRPGQYDQLGRLSYSNVNIAVGAQDDGPFLLRGWGGRESDPQNQPFRWVVGDRATFVAPLRERVEVGERHRLPDYTLELTIEPYRTPDVRAQSLSILVNDNVVVADLPLERHLRTVAVHLPADVLVRYLNYFELRFAWGISPKGLGLGADARSLSARLTRIYLRRGAEPD